MSKGDWTSAQEDRSQDVWVFPFSLWKRESCFCLSLPSL